MVHVGTSFLMRRRSANLQGWPPWDYQGWDSNANGSTFIREAKGYHYYKVRTDFGVVENIFAPLTSTNGVASCIPMF